jgi:hypothetical protein
MPRRAARRTRLISHVRQLCMLGLPSQLVIPHVLETLERMLGADVASFHWADAAGSVAGLFVNEPNLLRAGNDYHRSAEHDTLLERTYGMAFAVAMRIRLTHLRSRRTAPRRASRSSTAIVGWCSSARRDAS